MTDIQEKPTESVASVLETTRSSHASEWFRRPKWMIGIAVVLAVLVLWLIMRSGNDGGKVTYQEEVAMRGQLVVKISATGNLQPTNQVDVGSELSGTIETVFVDDNDQVKKGQILAKLDTAKLKDQVQKSRAALAASKAKVQQIIATRHEAQTNLDRLQEVWKLSGGKVPSKNKMASAEATLARAIADEASARANVVQAQAALRSDRTNLSKATVRSPINGVVLLRQVEPGQTVAASLQAPILFTLAESLSNMELQVAVDEADVGQVSKGQKAIFNVDAYPNRHYPAEVTRVNFGAQTSEGVVSYLTILRVNNDDLSLRPGMTATAEITTLIKDNALLVPNAALRYEPQIEHQAKKSGSVLSSILPRPPRPKRNRQAKKNLEQGNVQNVWVLSEGKPKPVEVTIGATNGRFTEIIKGDLKEGAKVIMDSTGLTE